MYRLRRFLPQMPLVSMCPQQSFKPTTHHARRAMLSAFPTERWRHQENSTCTARSLKNIEYQRLYTWYPVEILHFLFTTRHRLGPIWILCIMCCDDKRGIRRKCGDVRKFEIDFFVSIVTYQLPITNPSRQAILQEGTRNSFPPTIWM